MALPSTLLELGRMCHRSVVLGVQLDTLPFVERHNLCNLPLSWELVGHKRQIPYMTDRWNNHWLGQLQDISVKVIHT